MGWWWQSLRCQSLGKNCFHVTTSPVRVCQQCKCFVCNLLRHYRSASIAQDLSTSSAPGADRPGACATDMQAHCTSHHYPTAVYQAPLGGRAVGVARDLLLGLGDGLPQAPEDNKPGAAVEASEGVLASEEGAAVEASEGVVSGRGKSAASRVAPPQNAQGDVEVDDTPSIPAWVVHWRVRLVELACLSTESWGHNMEALLQHSSGFKSEASDNL